MDNALVALSNELAAAVERAGRSVVIVNARHRIASSGVHWRQGVIVTAEHTVKHDEEITIGLGGGVTVPATLVGRDPGTDLAVLKADLQIPVADLSETPRQPGNLAMVIGRSADSGVNATMGVISAVSGSWRTWRGGIWISTSASTPRLYPGSSGGAVIDTQGHTLGIATSGLSRLAGLAVPRLHREPRGGRAAGEGSHLARLPRRRTAADRASGRPRRAAQADRSGGVIVLSVEPRLPRSAPAS